MGTTTSKVRFNAEKFSIKGTKQKLGILLHIPEYVFSIYLLEFNFEDLMVSVGGYLGLFIGLALKDVCEFIVDLVESMKKRILHKNSYSYK